jgi:hypothetical protein
MIVAQISDRQTAIAGAVEGSPAAPGMLHQGHVTIPVAHPFLRPERDGMAQLST